MLAKPLDGFSCRYDCTHARAKLRRDAALDESLRNKLEDGLIEACREVVRVNKLTEGCYLRPIIYLGYGEMGLNPLPCTVNVAIAACKFVAAFLSRSTAMLAEALLEVHDVNRFGLHAGPNLLDYMADGEEVPFTPAGAALYKTRSENFGGGPKNFRASASAKPASTACAPDSIQARASARNAISATPVTP